MLAEMKRSLKIIVGVVCIVLGFAALVTPLTPGSWLILVGLELLGLRILLENRLWAWVQARPNSKPAQIVRRLLCLRLRNPASRKKRTEGANAAGSDASMEISHPPDDADMTDRRHTDEFAGSPDRRGR